MLLLLLIVLSFFENLEFVLPIRYTEAVEQFRESVSGIRPYGR